MLQKREQRGRKKNTCTKAPHICVLTGYYVEQNSQNVSGLFPSSDITKNTTFRKLDLFPSSGEGGEKTPTQLGPLERANLNHWTMEKVQKNSVNSVQHTPSSESFQIYRLLRSSSKS
jgi:hypothetical protein